MNTFDEYLKEELKKRLLKRLAEEAWWCLICGEGGNYEGDRPDEYWFPPDDHVCDIKKFSCRRSY